MHFFLSFFLFLKKENTGVTPLDNYLNTLSLKIWSDVFEKIWAVTVVTSRCKVLVEWVH